MSKRPPLDPPRDEILRKINADPCYWPSENEILILESRPYIKTTPVKHPPPPRFQQMRLPGL